MSTTSKSSRLSYGPASFNDSLFWGLPGNQVYLANGAQAPDKQGGPRSSFWITNKMNAAYMWLCLNRTT